MEASNGVDSQPCQDPAISTLISWVVSNGGICNAELRRDTGTGVRGLYCAQNFEIKDEQE